MTDDQVVWHHAPREGGMYTGCCGLTPDQLPRPYHLTTDGTEVTCRNVRAVDVQSPTTTPPIIRCQLDA
jgi:hypothetical protein